MDCSLRPDLQPLSCPYTPPPSTHTLVSRPFKATSLRRPLLNPSCNPVPEKPSTAASTPPAASPDFKLATQGTTLRSRLSLPQPPSSRLRTLLSALSSWSVSPAAWGYRQGRADRAFFHTLAPAQIRRQARERREYIYKKVHEAQERATYDRKQALKDALASGKALPTELRAEARTVGKDLKYDEAQTGQFLSFPPLPGCLESVGWTGTEVFVVEGWGRVIGGTE